MGRRNVTKERQRELLNAYVKCVARRGFHGTTLDNIADMANIKRPAIRHFIGNRDQIRMALAQSFVVEAEKHVSDLSTILHLSKSQTTSAISSLLSNAVTVDRDRIIVISHLFVLCQDYPEYKPVMDKWFNTYAAFLTAILKKHYSDKAQVLKNIAYGIISTCLGYAVLNPVGSQNINTNIAGSIRHQLSTLNRK